MSPDGTTTPRLRLVTDAPAPRRRVVSRRREEVERENHEAARLSATDARWVLAVRVGQALEGGHQAILTPEKRRRLLAEGRHLGLRDFDTSLIIAIVQDGARTGEGLGQNVADRVALVRAARGRDRSPAEVLLLWAMALMLAGLWMLMLIRWVGA